MSDSSSYTAEAFGALSSALGFDPGTPEAYGTYHIAHTPLFFLGVFLLVFFVPSLCLSVVVCLFVRVLCVFEGFCGMSGFVWNVSVNTVEFRVF